jgi:hypothetical protein
MHADEHDAQRDGRLDQAGGQVHQAQGGEGERDAVGEGEGGDDFEQLLQPAAQQQQSDDERDVVGPMKM